MLLGRSQITPAERLRVVALMKESQSLGWRFLHATNEEITIHWFGTITESGCSTLADFIAIRPERIVLLIDTWGGASNPAWNLGKKLAAHGRVAAHVVGKCYSAAMLLLGGCNQRTASADAKLMTHCANASVCGTSKVLRDTADRIDEEEIKIAPWMAERFEIPAGKWMAWHSGEDHYFTAEEALREGFVDRLTDPPISIPPLTPDETDDGEDSDIALGLARALIQLKPSPELRKQLIEALNQPS